MRHVFINKTVFFPEEGILTVGDLHIGYEKLLQDIGISLPKTQLKEIISDLEKIFTKIKKSNLKIKKVIFLGDIKEFFGYEWTEKKDFSQVIELVKKHVPEKDIILIKGNHDKFDFSGKKMKNYYIYKDVAFLHGHIEFEQAFDKKIKTVVMGHIHPSVIISDKQKVKKEKYKCFLVGKLKRKEMIILPSFFKIIEGTSVNLYQDEYEDYFSIVPRKTLLNFTIHVVDEDSDKVYDFGKIKNLD